MESLFVGATVGFLFPFYTYACLHIAYNAYHNIPKCKQYIISKMFYRKIKLCFEFDTDNFFFNQININNFPIKTSIKYEIGDVLYKKIIHIKENDYSEFRLRVFRNTEEEEEDVRNWNYYMNNGQVYKFKSLSYEYI